MLRQFFVFTLVVTSCAFAQGKEFKGVTLPDEVQVGDVKLKLNGMGIRKAMSLFDVYVGALYLAEPSSDTAAILKTTTPKRIVMQFKRFVDKDKLKEAWEKGFGNNKEDGYSYKEDLIKLKNITTNMKEGEKITLTFFGDHAEVQIRDEAPVSFAGASFSKVMLRVFIDSPPDSDLKKGLLGK